MPTDSQSATEAALPPPGKAAWSRRSWLILTAKLALTGGLLAALAVRLDWSDVAARLATADWRPLALALAVLMAGTAIAAERWYRLMRHLALDVRRALAFRATFAGWFLGQFLPGTVGGDAARLWFLWRARQPLRDSVQSVVLDRVAALIAVLVLILASLPHLFALAAPEMARSALAAALLASGAVGLFLLVEPPWPHWLRRGRVAAVLDFVDALRRSLRSRAAALAVALALVMHLLTVTAVILIAAALGIAVGYRDTIGIVATATLLSAVPISINGWGVREGTMVAGFALIGISAQDAFLISVIYGLGVMAAVSPGSVLWLGGWRTGGR